MWYQLHEQRLAGWGSISAQLTVNTTFSNGGSVLAAMQHLVTGSQRIEDRAQRSGVVGDVEAPNDQ